ncbi:MAG: sulfatase [Parabacteroides sp.]|nr:sulfatase [Parabacteroides sp.]
MMTKWIFLSMFSFATSIVASKEKSPNIILIFIDDFGYGDLGCYGNTLNRTPHIDKMAEDGVRLTDFYVGSSVSSPSRAALMTGCYPKRISMHVNADPVPLMGKSRQVLFPISMKGLNPSEITIAEVLKQGGYSTACIGKWHLGDQLCFLPTKQGFDYFYGLPYSHDMGKDYCALPLMEQNSVIEAPVGSDSLTYKLTIKAQQYIRDNKKKPFFLYLAHCMTHKPLDASPQFKGHSKNGIYGDAVEELDWSVGEILKTLKEVEIFDNTLIIFTSDNGAARGAGGSNKPLRGWKAETYEGGFRVPCIIHYPKEIQGNQVNHNIITSMDLLPTIASYCQVELPNNLVIDGRDISLVLEGKKNVTDKRVFYYYQRNQLQAVRFGKWKYHLGLKQRLCNAASDKMEDVSPKLYNLETDISESVNVLKENQSIEKVMLDLIKQVQNDLGDWNIEGKNVRPAGFIDEPFGRFVKK